MGRSLKCSNSYKNRFRGLAVLLNIVFEICGLLRHICLCCFIFLLGSCSTQHPWSWSCWMRLKENASVEWVGHRIGLMINHWSCFCSYVIILCGLYASWIMRGSHFVNWVWQMSALLGRFRWANLPYTKIPSVDCCKILENFQLSWTSNSGQISSLKYLGQPWYSAQSLQEGILACC